MRKLALMSRRAYARRETRLPGPGPAEYRGAVTFRAGNPPAGRPLLRTLLGDALRRIRLEQGRTLADVAGEARVSMPYLSEIERGRKEASSEILAAVCGALGIELAEVLDIIGTELAGTGLAGTGLAGTGPGRHPAEVIRLDPAGSRLAGRPGHGPADARALLAA